MEYEKIRLSLPNKIGDLLDLWANSRPEKILVGDLNRHFTYREIREYVEVFKSEISDFIKKRTIIFAERSIEYVIAYLSVLSTESVLIPIDKLQSDYERSREINSFAGEIILSFEPIDKYDLLKVLNIGDLKAIYVYSGQASTHETSDMPKGAAFLLHTSGTTNRPKRIIMGHQQIMLNALSHCEHMGITSDDNTLLVLPIHFGYCNTAQLVATLTLGGTFYLMDAPFSPHLLFKYSEALKISITTLVPSMMHQLLSFQQSRNVNFSSMRLICFGGGSCSPNLLKDIRHTNENVMFCQTYGQTEAGPRVTGVSPRDYPRGVENMSCGTPIPGVEIQIRKIDGFGSNERDLGEILVKSEGIMLGYYPISESSNVKDGWLETGDAGYLDEFGDLVVTTRIKNIIIRAGVNIYPEEIEGVILDHPSVYECYVAPEKHEYLGEIPVAYVKFSKNNVEQNVEVLRDYLKSVLSPHKIPRIEVSDDIIKTYNGKIYRGKS